MNIYQEQPRRQGMINGYNPRDMVDKAKVREGVREHREGGASSAPQMLLCDFYSFVAVTDT